VSWSDTLKHAEGGISNDFPRENRSFHILDRHPAQRFSEHKTRHYSAERNSDQERFAFLSFAGKAFLIAIPQGGLASK
jgi:hypothetical protein